MVELKYKVGDIVIGVKNSFRYADVQIKGKVGVIEEKLEVFRYPYKIKFKEQIDFGFDKDHRGAYWAWFRDEDIKPINAIKLKKLLKDNL